MAVEYSYMIEQIQGSGFIVIRDGPNYPFSESVTNIMEKVIDEICEKERINPVEHYIIYRDGEGNYNGFNFSTKQFVPIMEKTWKKAAEKYLAAK